MAFPKRLKQPDEKRTLTFDFSAKIVPGTTLTGAATLIAETGLTVSSGTVAATTVTCQVSGGILGTAYKVTCRCNATNGDILELDATVVIKEVN